MAASRSPYLYSPLQKGHVRLLELLPGIQDEEIVIDIVHRAEQSQPKYEALSYVWGSSDRTHKITVAYTASSCATHNGKHLSKALDHLGQESADQNHRTLAIGENLFIALKHLRSEKVPRVLWIDAICINQDDTAEKSKEVAKMGEIYRNAHQVVVWLGEESDDSPLAISLLAAIGKDMEYTEHQAAFMFQTRLESHLALLEASSGLIEASRPSWTAINKLFERPWFTRLWVLQEISLSSDAMVVVGSETIPWDIFRGALLWIQANSRSILFEFFSLQTIDALQPATTPLSGQSLYHLSLNSMYSNCLEPRDRIYGVLNLLHLDVAALVTPDYSQPIKDVFTTAVLADIEGSQTMDILSVCSFSDVSSRIQSPSWVPNFSDVAGFQPWTTLSRASGHSRSEFSYNKDESTLILRGRFIDTISHISSPIPPNATLQDCLEICRQWEPLDAYTTPYITGGLLIEAFVSAVSASYIVEMVNERADFKMEHLISKYQRLMMGDKDIDQALSRFAREIHAFLGGRSLFRTEKGYVGIGLALNRIGDHVCIVVGCDRPLIVRAASILSGYYELGGGCHIPGLQFSEGLLGPLTSGWSCSFVLRKGYHILEFYGPHGEETQLDPRAGPIPAGWEVYDANGGEDEDQLVTFKNYAMDEDTFFDPRLKPENLKKIGIEIQDIILV